MTKEFYRGYKIVSQGVRYKVIGIAFTFYSLIDAKKHIDAQIEVASIGGYF